MKVWISKYALTQGVRYTNGEPVKGIYFLGIGTHEWYDRDEWHKTPEEAVAKAEEMRKRKLASLEKQVAKLRALTF